MSARLAYLLPLLVGALVCACIWPAQLDRLAEDEARDVFRAFALARGETGLWESWAGSVHPPLAPALAALGLGFVPASIAMRLPALLAGLATLVLVVALGRRTGRAEAGLLAGLLLAASPIWWAYSSAISLDLPLAAFATLGAVATVGPRRSIPLALLAVLGAALTKRHGLSVVVIAMLLASLCNGRPTPTLRVGALLGVAAVALATAWRYCVNGQDLFGSAGRLDELLITSPVFLAIGLAGAIALGFVYRRAEPSRRSLLLPLVLFGLPLVISPLVGSHPAPRYLLPAVPIGCVLAATAVWLGANGVASRRLRWAVSGTLVAGSFLAQWADLHAAYWPRHRGHQDAIVWLAEHASPRDRILSPEGPFLEAAALLASVPAPAIVNVDRGTCAGLEAQLLAGSSAGCWVVLPLYRDLGWPDPFEEHAAAMGLELRALVRRDVAAGPRPWQRARVESLGPPDGAPVLAILHCSQPPERHRMDAGARPLALARFTGVAPSGWHAAHVELAPGAAGGAELRFRDGPSPARFYAGSLREGAQVATTDWHHHRWLELCVDADDAALAAIDLIVGWRSDTFAVRLSGLQQEPGCDDARRRLRLDLSALPIEQTSRVGWLMLSAPDGAARLELHELRLVPDAGAVPQASGVPR